MSPPPSAPPPAREPRGARRKRETREKLLTSAFELMAVRGAEGVTIHEITDAADVGFGSFYNHFASKEAIYEAVFRRVFDEFADALDQRTVGLEDTAEIIAISVRHTILRAQSEPRWGQFLLRESLTPRGLTEGLAARLLRDVQRGVASERFAVTDPVLAVLAAGGTVMSCVALQSAAAVDTKVNALLGDLPGALPQRAASTVLKALGVPAPEAERLAHAPLPALDNDAAS